MMLLNPSTSLYSKNVMASDKGKEESHRAPEKLIQGLLVFDHTNKLNCYLII